MRNPLPRRERRAVQLAGVALTAARANDWPRAVKMLQRINDECGPDGAGRALLSLCDTAIAEMGIPPGAPVHIQYKNIDTQQVQGADEVEKREVVWAGRMLAARAAQDQDTWDALIETLPDDPRVMGQHALALLQMVALNPRVYRGGAR